MASPVSPTTSTPTPAEPWHHTETTKVTINALEFTITKSSTSSHVPPPPAPATPDNSAILSGLQALAQAIDMIVARLDGTPPSAPANVDA